MMEQVLFVGPQFKNHRGGIGAVLEVYAENITPFKYVPTFVTGSSMSKVLAFLRGWFSVLGMLLRDNRIRIVHIHTSSHGSFFRKSAVLMLAKAFNKKVILHVHSGGFHLFYQNSNALVRWYIRKVISKADLLIALSDHWQKYFIDTFGHRNTAIVKNVFRAPSSVGIANENGNGPLRLLFLGLITENKGIFDLIEVLRSDTAAFDGGIALSIGGKGDLERMNKLSETENKIAPIHYHGWVTGDEKNRLLSECDIYILPSYYEGLPISILEAMGHAKPVVATNVGGVPEVVQPGFNGWLFEPGDRTALRSILVEAMNNRALLKTYGQNSYALAQQYSPSAVIAHLSELYAALLHPSAR